MNLRDKLYSLSEDYVLNVSKMRPDGRGAILSKKTARARLLMIDNVPIVSNNCESYELATRLLGPDYYYLADYCIIVSEIKKGNKQFIKDIAETNFPALISNQCVFDFAMKVLGDNYKYMKNYYDIAISIRDEIDEDVLFYLENFDPRDDNDFLYHIAVQFGKQRYINLIKEEIIKRDWVEKQALKNILGVNSPYKELHQRMRLMNL
jgi:hypothetical protein